MCCSVDRMFVGLVVSVSIDCVVYIGVLYVCFFFFQAEDGIRDLVRSRGLGDVYKRQIQSCFGMREIWNRSAKNIYQIIFKLGI